MAEFKKSVSVPLPTNLAEALKKEAQHDFIATAALVRILIVEGLRKRGWILSDATREDLEITGRFLV